VVSGYGLAQRHVLVTGAAGVLGQSVAEAFEAAGAVVHAPARSLDVTDEGVIAELYASLPPLWASVHVVGGFLWRPLLETALADLRAQLDVNLGSAFLCTREAARQMLGRGGRIVNVASRIAEAPAPGMAAYASSKAALVALTKTAALELRGHGILVNAVAPTIIDTPANRAAMPAAPHDSWARPAQIARAIAWLASPENELVTGALVPVGGADGA
jgi:NAD(P)-dependent dehydrogenase (short-subunit alcohol dehydrogenase family)